MEIVSYGSHGTEERVLTMAQSVFALTSGGRPIEYNIVNNIGIHVKCYHAVTFSVLRRDQCK